MQTKLGDKKQILSGLLFVLVGVAYASISYQTLTIGTADNMGPGYFPIVLALFLAIIGIVLVVQSLKKTESQFGNIPYRGLVLVLLAPILFALSLKYFGFVPSTFASTFVATLASDEGNLKESLIISAFVTIFCTVVFVYGFGVQTPLFGS